MHTAVTTIVASRHIDSRLLILIKILQAIAFSPAPTMLLPPLDPIRWKPYLNSMTKASSPQGHALILTTRNLQQVKGDRTTRNFPHLLMSHAMLSHIIALVRLSPKYA
jgi:hypothetical protein